jgi:hypothetical protein
VFYKLPAMSQRTDVLAAIPRHNIRVSRGGDNWAEHYHLGDDNVDDHIAALIADGLVVNTVSGLSVTPAGQEQLLGGQTD